MRPFLIAILTFTLLSSSAQTGKKKIFKQTDYMNGNLYSKVFDTIKVSDERLDVYFLKRHFYSPYYLPEKFIDKQYKNQKVSIWHDPTKKKDYRHNWENTYTYDSLSRVTNFTYSGCLICSNFPYNYTVTYNYNGQVEKISNSTNMKETFKFYYNSNGDIVRFEKFSSDKLETRIALVN